MERKGFLVNKAFNKYLWASVLTVAASQIANIVDASLVGNIIGAEGLAAVVISKPVLQAIYAISCIYVASSTIMTGMALGKGNREKANTLFTFSLIVSVVLGVIISVGGIIFIEPIMDLLCKSEEMRPVAKPFMVVTILSALPQLLMYTLQQYVTIDGSPKLITKSVIVGNVVNVILAVVFMKYFGMGIAGAGWGTFFMYVVIVLMTLPHFRKKDSIRPCLGKFGKYIEAKQLLTLGTPLFLSTVLISVQYTCYNNTATTYLGSFGLIAMAVCLQLQSFSMIILTGTLRTIQPVGAILKGIGDHQGVLMLLKRAYKFMVLGLLIYCALIVFCPVEIARFLGVNSKDAIPTIIIALPAFSLNIVMQSLIYNLMPVYQFYGHHRMALIISLGQTLLPIVGFWGLAVLGSSNSSLFTLHSSPNVAWLGFFLGQLATGVLLFICSWYERRKTRNATKSKMDLVPMCLIPRSEEFPVLDFSFGYSKDDEHKAFEEMSQWLKDQSLDNSVIFKVRIIAEELMTNIIRHSEQKNKHAYADIKLIVMPDVVQFALTDDGTPFNPIENKDKGYGLMIANGAASEIKYKYQFGQNMTTVQVKL